MGQVDLNFKPSVPVFDANVALGRRHDKRVKFDTVEDTLKAMDRAGIDRVLVYAPHAALFDSGDGNQLLLETIQGQPRLVPQFVCNPSWDDLDSFAEQVKQEGVRAVRICPISHDYPFRDWVVKPWLEWLAAERIPVWLSAGEFDPSALHDTLKEHPGVAVVLSEVHYSHASWAIPLLRSLPNLSIELSRFVIADGIPRLVKAIGDKRILYGSRFPEAAMGPQLYNVHHCRLSEASLRGICSGNLERLLGLE